MTHRLLWQNNKRSACWIGGTSLLEHNSLASCPREALFPGTLLDPAAAHQSFYPETWLTSGMITTQDHICHEQFLRLCSKARTWTWVWEILRLMAASSVMSLSSPSVLLVNLERVHGTRRGWGVGAGVGKAVPVSVTTLGIFSSSSVAGGFSSHSLYLNTEV